MSSEQTLALGIKELGLEVTRGTQLKMLDFLSLLQKWNKVYSLTAIRQTEEMVSLHLLDSLSVSSHLWPGRWLDVGCGAGLPGLVLALVHPDWEFTLLDSNSKKTSFVQQAVIELGLTNVSVRCERVENLQQEEKFDGIISRAFANLDEFTMLTRHLLATKGRWVAMKGLPDQELRQLSPGIIVDRIITLQVPGLEAARCLVVLKQE